MVFDPVTYYLYESELFRIKNVGTYNVVVQPPYDEYGDPQPMVVDRYGHVLVDHNGYVVNKYAGSIGFKTQTAGIQEAVTFLQNIGIQKGTKISGVIYIRNGVYTLYQSVNLPALYVVGTSTVLNLLTVGGTVISPAPVDYIDLYFVGESRRGTVLVMGDGVTTNAGGFIGSTYAVVRTEYAFMNMTWEPNPNYPAQGHVSEAYANFFGGVVSSFIFKNMTLRGKIGQNVDFSVFTGSIDNFSGFRNIIDDVEIRYIPGINLNVTGRVFVGIRNLDLFNSGYTDNAFAINGGSSSNEGMIIIDGLLLGQNVPIPSGVTPGGGGQFVLTAGTATASMPVFGRNIVVLPTVQNGNNSSGWVAPFTYSNWNNLDLDIYVYDNYLGFPQTSYSNIRVKFVNDQAGTLSFTVWGTITYSTLEISAYNLYSSNVGWPLLNVNQPLQNVRLIVNVYGNAFGTASALIGNYVSTASLFSVEFDGDLTDQLNNAPNVSISYVPFKRVLPTARPYDRIAINLGFTTPSVPSSGSVVYNTYPVSALAYLYGGTVTQVQVVKSYGTITIFNTSSGVSLPLTPVRLDPGDGIILTYSSAPSWTWVPI